MSRSFCGTFGPAPYESIASAHHQGDSDVLPVAPVRAPLGLDDVRCGAPATRLEHLGVESWRSHRPARLGGTPPSRHCSLERNSCRILSLTWPGPVAIMGACGGHAHARGSSRDPLTSMTPMAYADPPDPTWLSGFWDDDDFDNVVGLLTSATALVAPLVVDAGPLPVSDDWIEVSQAPATSTSTRSLSCPRAPPVSPSSDS